MSFKRSTTLDTSILFVASIFLFTAGLSHQEIIGFEARFYLFALEMWRHGLTWFPTTYGQPYPDYPITAIAFIYAIANWVGHLTKLVAVLPSAMAAAMTVVGTYLIGALQERRWGWYAVCLLLLTNVFVMEARTISLDQYIAMVTVLSFYVVYSAELLQKKRRLMWIPVLFLLGFAIRGPIGLIVPVAVIFMFYLLEKNIRGLLFVGLITMVIMLIGCLVLFGLAYHVGGASFTNAVLKMQVVGRLQSVGLPWYFYFKESVGAYAISYPLAAIMIVLLGKTLLQREKAKDLQLIGYLIAWVLVIMLGLSIPAGKKIRYILACAPALALISAYLFVSPVSNRALYFLQRFVYLICYWLPLCCFILIFIIQYAAEKNSVWLSIHYDQCALGFLVLQLLSVAGRWCHQSIRVGIVLGAAALTFILFYASVVEAINLTLNRTQDFVLLVEKIRQQRHAALGFYREPADALPIKYFADMTSESRPYFTDMLPDKSAVPILWITHAEYFSTIPVDQLKRLHIVSQGKIGRESVVVFMVYP